MNPAANQRSAVISTNAPVPDVRTVAARATQSSGRPMAAPVHSSVAVDNRSGASSISCRPTAPPMESPA